MSKEWLKVFHSLQESQRRWLAASKSIELGYGGTSKVSRATGLSRTTVTQGVKEIKGPDCMFKHIKQRKSASQQ